MNDYKPKLADKWFAQTYYQELHFLLGKITVNYNLIESNCMTLICNFLDPNDITVGFKKCQNYGATKIVNLLYTLFNQNVKNSDTKRLFNEIYNELKQVIDERNKYIHSIYMDSENKSIKLKPNLKYVRMVGIRELQSGTKTPMSTVLPHIVPLRALVQWLDHLYDQTEKLFNMVRQEIPMKTIMFATGEEPVFVKPKKKRKWLF